MSADNSTLQASGFDDPALWQANLGAAFADLRSDPLSRGMPPSGRLQGLELGGAAVFKVSGSPQSVRRTTSATRHSPADMLKVCVQLHGRATVHQDDREIVLDPGQFAVYDMGRPYALRLEGTWACAVMAVRRDLIEIPDARLHIAMKRAYSSVYGLGLVLSQFITSTVSQLDSVEAAAARNLGEAGACLLAGSLAGDGDAAVAGASQVLSLAEQLRRSDQGTTTTGQRASRASLPGTEPAKRCQIRAGAPITSASARSSATMTASSLAGLPCLARTWTANSQVPMTWSISRSSRCSRSLASYGSSTCPVMISLEMPTEITYTTSRGRFSCLAMPAA